MPVTLYTTRYCGYCHLAEDLLRRHAIPFQAIDVTGDHAARAALVKRANGQRTVPVIFHGDNLIGGYTELAAKLASGGLAPLPAS
jgi:glutaredoxin 3